MKREQVAVGIIAVFYLVTFFLTDVIWPPGNAAVKLEGGYAIFFQFVNDMESLLFGLGIAFFYLMFPTFKKGIKMKHWPTVFSILALTWMFLNWWPHDNMHLYFGEAMNKLIFIEMFFHGSMIVAVCVVAYSYYRAVTGETQ